MRLVVSRRIQTPKGYAFVAPFLSIGVGLGLGAILLVAVGHDPWTVYRTMATGAFGNAYNLSETVVEAIPLMLTGLGVGIAARIGLWNIGGDGQLVLGACAASWLALFHPELPQGIMLPSMLVLGFVAGGVWAAVAALPRVMWGISEVITTLMFNYVAIFWIQYLVQGPWRDPLLGAFPLTAQFPEAASLPSFGGTRIHLGLVFALLGAIGLWLLLYRTRWGFEIRVVGASGRAAQYAGMRVALSMLFVLFLSGGLAGVAGMAEVAGIFHRLQDGIGAGAGYNAFILVAFAGGNPFGILVVAVLFGALLNGGVAAQGIGVSPQVSDMLQGLILFIALASEFPKRYRVSLERARQPPAARAETGGP